MNTTTNFRTKRMVQLALFIAIIVLMAFTPIGYIKTMGIEITLLVVPVAVGAIVLGPVSGAILGGVFGITSFIQCFGLSPFGAMLLSINPAATFVLCLVPRVLMGWLTGLIFIGLRKVDRRGAVSYAAASLAGPLLNTTLFILMFLPFFYKTDYIQGMAKQFHTDNVMAFIAAFVGVNGVIEAAICFILGTAISKAIDIFSRKSGIK